MSANTGTPYKRLDPPNPKIAKWTWAALIELTCPYCEEGMEGPSSGSLLINEDDYACYDESDNLTTCQNCGAKVRVPHNPFYRPRQPS